MSGMLKYFFWLMYLSVLPLLACSNSPEEEVSTNVFNVQFELPEWVDVVKGGEYAIKVRNGESPQLSDSFIIESNEGIFYICPFVSISSESCTVRIPADCETGYYKVYIRRNDDMIQIYFTRN